MIEIIGPTEQFELTCEKIKKSLHDYYCNLELINLKGKKENVSVECVFTDIKCVPYPNDIKDRAENCVEKFQDYQENIVILGLPGSGKSTLIKRLLFQAANDIQDKKIIPIYLELKTEFAYETDGSEFKNLRRYKNFKDYARYFFNKLGENFGKDFFDNFPNEDYTYVVLCDGLDEISAENYTAFNNFVNSVVADPTMKNKVKFFISSRYQGFKLSDYKTSFKKYSLLSLDVSQIQGYIDKYFNLFGGEDNGKRDLLKEKIEKNVAFQEMANSPILLSLLCVVNDIENINDRTALFEKAITKLLTEHGGISDEFLDDLLLFLEDIAVCFFKQDKLENFEEGELQFYANKMMQEELKKNFLHCGLFDENSDRKVGGYKFYHRTIWEYLVAKGMLKRPEEEIYERAEMKAWSVPIKMWAIMFSKQHADTPQAIGDMFEELWKHNKALTLECLSEYENCDEILTVLYSSMGKRQKLRLIGTLRESYINAPDYKAQAVDMIDKALRLIHKKEKEIGKDCEVIYQYVDFLEEFRCETKFAQLLDDIFDYAHLEERMKLLEKVGLRFINVDPGCFDMGRNKFTIPEGAVVEDYISIDDEETPKHKVRITKEFQIAQTLITNEMFYECGFPFASEKHGYDETTRVYRNSYSPTGVHPVNFVTWYEAMIFAKWLKCTLPSEAEWEYACLSCGNETQLIDIKEQKKMREYLAGADNAGEIAGGEMRAHYSFAGNTTLPRAIFKNNDYEISDNDIRRNRLGLIDMLGNLREWCLDWFSEDFYKKCDVSNYSGFANDINNAISEKGDVATVSYYYRKNASAPQLLTNEIVDDDIYTFDKDGYCIDPIKKYIGSAENKCIRGGCFDWNVTNLRPSYRNHNPATNVYKVNGFRIVKK